jgi:hypothetical protein
MCLTNNHHHPCPNVPQCWDPPERLYCPPGSRSLCLYASVNRLATRSSLSVSTEFTTMIALCQIRPTGSNICVIAGLSLGLAWGPFLVICQMGCCGACFRAAILGSTRDSIQTNDIHTKFATRLTPESATYMGKGKPYEDTVLSPWMYLRISGCILL